MAEVPYSPVPSQGVQPGGPSPVHIDTPDAAFGGATARALEGLGKVQMGAGQEVFARAMEFQGLENEAQARNADAKYMIEAGKLHAQFTSLRGIDAKNALPKYQQDLEGLRTNIRGELNPAAARMYDASSLSTLGRTIFNGAGHAGNEFSRYLIGSENGAIHAAKLNALTYWKDDGVWNDTVSKIKEGNERLAVQHGWSSTEKQAHIDDDIAESWYHRTSMQAITDPFGAREIYKSHRGEFGKFQPETERMLERQEAVVGSMKIEQGLVTGSYYDRLSMKESGGDIFAKAKTSTSKSLFGFTDGTWSMVRVEHPDLNLPATVGQASPKQQRAAAEAFTSGNQKKLGDAGIAPTEQNLYMAHFLGAPGAIKYLNGMKDDPGQPATKLVSKAAVNANKDIFYNPDGSERSAASTYMRLTSSFAGPGALTEDSPASWLSEAEKSATAIAKEVAPDNSQLQEAVLTRVRTRFNLVRNGAIQAQRGDLVDLLDAVQGGGDPNKRIKDIQTILDNPVAREKYNNLDPKYRNQVDNLILKYAKQDIPMTPERQRKYYEAVGKIDNPETRSQGLNLDITSLDLPQKETGILLNKQKAALSKAEREDKLKWALSLPTVHNLIASIKMTADEKNEFDGRLSEQLRTYEQIHKVPPKPKEIEGMVSDLVATHGGFWGMFSSYNFAVPSDFKKEITPIFKAGKNGREPNSVELSQMYQYSLTHPDWRKELSGR